jgi:hypothetical protein
MKRARKNVKKINVFGDDFFYMVHERRDFVRFRIYSTKWKSSFIDMHFTWKDNWATNFFKPSVAARLVQYAVDQGWRYKEEKRTMVISPASHLIKELEIES